MTGDCFIPHRISDAGRARHARQIAHHRVVRSRQRARLKLCYSRHVRNCRQHRVVSRRQRRSQFRVGRQVVHAGLCRRCLGRVVGCCQRHGAARSSRRRRQVVRLGLDGCNFGIHRSEDSRNFGIHISGQRCHVRTYARPCRRAQAGVSVTALRVVRASRQRANNSGK